MKKKTKLERELLNSLLECYWLIEHNTKGLALDEKDSARVLLVKHGMICKPEPTFEKKAKS